jgi:hypothetical protein
MFIPSSVKSNGTTLFIVIPNNFFKACGYTWALTCPPAWAPMPHSRSHRRNLPITKDQEKIYLETIRKASLEPEMTHKEG